MAGANMAIQLWMDLDEAKKLFEKIKDDRSLDSLSEPLNKTIQEMTANKKTTI